MQLKTNRSAIMTIEQMLNNLHNMALNTSTVKPAVKPKK